MQKVEANKTYLGIIEDNNDPKRMGRVRARVLDVFDDLKVEDIPWAKPWKDLNGNSANIPDKGKVVTVVFESGNTYKPEYIYADHYNSNLEKKLTQISEEDYLSMKALIFDHKTQIYVNDSEGLKLDHKFNNVNIKDKSINLNLKDNFAKINLGTANSTQRSILGDNFLNWFDDFVQILLGDKGGPFLGNLGAPVIATPALMGSLQTYQQLKNPKFLSKNVYIVDNEDVSKLDRIAEGQKGDTWASTVKDNDLSKVEAVPYTPTSGSSETTFEKPSPTSGTQSEVLPKPKPVDHPDIKILLEIIRLKNYELYEKQFEMNIISIRNQCLKVGDKYSDEFVDNLYLLYKDASNNWDMKKYNFSTMPGVEFEVTDSWLSEKKLNGVPNWENIKVTNPKMTMKEYYSIETPKVREEIESGLMILVPSQYKNVYQISTYRGAPAMVTIPTSLQIVWIDKDFSKRYEFSPSNYTSPEKGKGSGDFKIGIHIGYPGGKKVGDWSEGSHTFPTSDSLNEFFELCNKHKDKWGNSFTYTLATKNDWDEAAKNSAINKIEAPRITPPVIPSVQTVSIPDNVVSPLGENPDDISMPPGEMWD